MMGLIGQGCEHGDVLEVTGTNTPTQKNTPSVFHVWAMRIARLIAPRACVCRKKEKNDYCVCVCCTVFDATRCLHPVGVWGWFVSKVCVGGFSVEGTPGPVPIPVAKLDCADGTAIVGLWESKTPPTHIT